MIKSGEIKQNFTVTGTACQPLAPDFTSAPACCCPIRGCDDCEPRVRLKDYVRVKPAFEETCFLIGEDTCEREIMPAHLHCFEARVYRRGVCSPVLLLAPIRATPAGAVCFKWPAAFWLLGDGKYEMDIGFDGKCSVVVGLDVVGCHQAVLEIQHNLSSACEVIPYCAPEVEDEPYTENFDCGSGCNA